MKNNMVIKYHNDKAREQKEEKEQKAREYAFFNAQNILRNTASEILEKYAKK